MKVRCKKCGNLLTTKDCCRWFRGDETAWNCEECGYTTEEEEL